MSRYKKLESLKRILMKLRARQPSSTGRKPRILPVARGLSWALRLPNDDRQVLTCHQKFLRVLKNPLNQHLKMQV